MGVLFLLIGAPVAIFIGLWLLAWLIWILLKALGRKIAKFLLGPKDITP